MEQRPNEGKFDFDRNGRLSPADWDRLLSRLDEEIREAEEAAARKAGWSEEMDELYFFDMEDFAEEETEGEIEEEEEGGEENEGEQDEEIPEWEMDLDAF